MRGLLIKLIGVITLNPKSFDSVPPARDSGLMLFVSVKRMLEKIADLLIIVAFVVLLVVSSLQIFSRYVLNYPLYWSEELARYVFVWLVFLSSSVAFRQGRHLSLDLVHRRLSPATQRLLDILVLLLILAVLVTVVFVSPQILTITMRQKSASLSIPMALVYLAFPLSSVLMILHIMIRLYELLTMNKGGDN